MILNPSLRSSKLVKKMNVAEGRASNGCQWHLGPQVAVFGMALGLWREGMDFLNSFTHHEVRYGELKKILINRSFH
jgi:hypothetical protein